MTCTDIDTLAISKCLFCLKVYDDNRRIGEEVLAKLRILDKYLSSVKVKDIGGVKGAELIPFDSSICRLCLAMVNSFVVHYRNLMMTKMRVEASVVRVQDILIGSKQDGGDGEDEGNREENDEEWERWRNKLVKKCSSKLEKSLPAVDLTRIIIPDVKDPVLSKGGGPSSRKRSLPAATKEVERFPELNGPGSSKKSKTESEEVGAVLPRNFVGFRFVKLWRRRGCKGLYYYQCITCSKTVTNTSQHLRQDHKEVLIGGSQQRLKPGKLEKVVNISQRLRRNNGLLPKYMSRIGDIKKYRKTYSLYHCSLCDINVESPQLTNHFKKHRLKLLKSEFGSQAFQSKRDKETHVLNHHHSKQESQDQDPIKAEEGQGLRKEDGKAKVNIPKRKSSSFAKLKKKQSLQKCRSLKQHVDPPNCPRLEQVISTSCDKNSSTTTKFLTPNLPNRNLTKIECDLCQKTFCSKGGLYDHRACSHPAEILKAYRRSRMRKDKFQSCVEELLANLDEEFQKKRKGSNHTTGSTVLHHCPLCPRVERGPSKLKRHVVYCHKQEIGARLEELQDRKTSSRD